MLRGLRNREIIRYLGVPLWKIPAIVVNARQIAALEAEQSKLFSGTHRMLSELAGAGIVLGIVTSNSEETVRRALGEETAIRGTTSRFTGLAFPTSIPTNSSCPLLFGAAIFTRMPAEIVHAANGRVVCPGFPHHLTQRGIRRFDVFLDEADHLRYRELLNHYARQYGLGIAALYTGRPCGSEEFVKKIQAIVGRRLAPGKPGPKPKQKAEPERML
jgi:hypothetical protein